MIQESRMDEDEDEDEDEEDEDEDEDEDDDEDDDDDDDDDEDEDEDEDEEDEEDEEDVDDVDDVDDDDDDDDDKTEPNSLYIYMLYDLYDVICFYKWFVIHNPDLLYGLWSVPVGCRQSKLRICARSCIAISHWLSCDAPVPWIPLQQLAINAYRKNRFVLSKWNWQTINSPTTSCHGGGD